MTAASRPGAGAPAEKLILPPAEFADDEELLTWLELCRRTSLKAADELDEDSAYIFAKLARFARSQGMGGFQAKRTARAVALPITRAAESMNDVAGYLRLGSRRAEAFVEAVQPRRRRGNDGFSIKGGS